MLRRVVLVRTDVLEKRISSIIRATRLAELGTTSAMTSNRSTLSASVLVSAKIVPSSPVLVTLILEVIGSSETSVLTQDTHLNMRVDGVIYSHVVKTSVLSSVCIYPHISFCMSESHSILYSYVQLNDLLHKSLQSACYL
jgi:hypothetical protein